MQIESSKNANCVNRALSTMRLMLGLNGLLPFKFTYGKTSVKDIVKNIGLCFPDNEIYIWCLSENFMDAKINVHFCGTNYQQKYDDIKYAMCFSYGLRSGDGHMVVGEPCAYGDTEISSVIMVME